MKKNLQSCLIMGLAVSNSTVTAEDDAQDAAASQAALVESLCMIQPDGKESLGMEITCRRVA